MATAPHFQDIRVGAHGASASLAPDVEHQRPLARPALDVSVREGLIIRVKVHEGLLRQVLDEAARELTTAPLLDTSQALVDIATASVDPVPGGITVAAQANVTLRVGGLAQTFGTTPPQVTAVVRVPLSPVFLEDGCVFISVAKPTVDVPASTPRLLSQAFGWVSAVLPWDKAMRDVLQAVIARRFDGRGLLELVQEMAPSLPPRVRRVLWMVDPDSARGALLLDASGEVVLDVLFRPTQMVKAAVYSLMAFAMLTLVAIAITVTVVIAKA